MDREIQWVLDLNYQRRTSLPLFAAIGEPGIRASTSNDLLIDAVAAVSAPILFEKLLCNENDLRALLIRLMSLLMDKG
jgi:hypothetical protein